MDGCTMVNIRTGPIIHDSFVYVSMGMYVSTKREDKKRLWSIKSMITQMEHNKNSGVSDRRTENNRTK